MKKNLVISSVAAIAALNPEGFTVSAANLQPVATGYAVALKRTQNSFGAEGLAKVMINFVSAKYFARKNTK